VQEGPADVVAPADVAVLATPVIPVPPGTDWVREDPQPGSSWSERREFVVDWGDGGRRPATGEIVAPLVRFTRGGEAVELAAYCTSSGEPHEVLESCCPDGGSESIIVVSSARISIALVAWGTRDKTRARNTLLRAWAALVKAELGD
jgi:hypothetical protein